MSKRLFAEVDSNNSPENATSVSQILKHAENLLKTVKALNEELQKFHGTSDINDEIVSVLKRHNDEILPTAQLLAQDEASALGQDNPRPQKARKLEDGGDSRSSLGARALPIPNHVSLTRWTPDDIPSSGLPPLPPVLDPVLEQAALTHSGMTSDPTKMSYERLEWIGDAYIYLMSTSFIFQTFPNLHVGRCSQLRERLVRNETLLNYTIQYGIDKRTKFPPEFGPLGKPGATRASEVARKKALGDVFESYVAATILADPGSLPRVSSWLKSLWSTELADEIRAEFRGKSSSKHDRSNKKQDTDSDKKATRQDLPYKVILRNAIVVNGIKLSYNDVGELKKDKHLGLPLYTIGVFLDGWGESNLQLGLGSALSKKEAGDNAARAALENKKLIKRLQKKKEEFMKSKILAESTQQEYDNWS
ncbi:ribonuclease III [Daldinia decipiens]|uniref:ribonuclease III n=1 Tax=Daldinia decipiens TaxID=326647 RepID=UPI0020C4CB9B|nr:ribonuclease III [Daldinia decipiens]KAI1652501.1 ribonuclease III [Daldinia decipiens]